MARGERITRLMLAFGRLFYRLKIEGEENIPPQGGCVFAFNHVAPIIDMMTGIVIFQRRPDTVSFGGRGLAGTGLIGRVMRRMQTSSQQTPMLGAYKARGLSAPELMKALAFLQKGHAVSLAAEGELTWDGRLQHPLAPGAAWMALRTHVPVVAVVSKGGYDIMPRWASRPHLTGRVTIRAGQPFYLSDAPISRLPDGVLDEASDRIYQAMAALHAA